MSMSIFSIAGSALTAQSQRMNVSASNMANAESVAGPDGQPYRAKHVIFQMDPLGNATNRHPIGGVKVEGVVQSQAPMRRQFDPNNPSADNEGYVSFPNVDVVAEMVDFISASRSYQANVEVVNTAKQMVQRTLAIGQ